MNKIKEIFQNISDQELHDAIKEIIESDKTGFITDGVVRKYVKICGEESNDLFMVQVNILKEGAFRWSLNRNKE
jgi:hypothetical protein